ncbi:MAG: hypothetical protein KIG86_01665 [Eubacteriales bacterium]|nr:hypothetical protein [Eubacteriales bacterium]
MAILKIKDPPTGEWQEVTVMQGKSGPQGPAGPNEITTETASSITGILKGNGSTVEVAIAGTDYASADQFLDLYDIVIGDQQSNIETYVVGNIIDAGAIMKAAKVDDGGRTRTLAVPAAPGTDYMAPPASATALPDSGTALTANTIYAVAVAVGTYAFTPPDTGWAHGMFTTDSSVSVSFSGTFVGAAPTIEASKVYEFDVFDGVWAVQEVVSA